MTRAVATSADGPNLTASGAVTSGVKASGVGRELLVFADDWGRHPSSCQHLVRRLRDEYRVLWANTIGTRSPKADGFTLRRGIEKLNQWRRGLQQETPTMAVLDLPMLPRVGGRIAEAANRTLVGTRLRVALRQCGMSRPVVLTTLPFVANLVRRVPRSGLVYYCTDDFSQWPGADRESLLAAERETLAQADLVLAVSRALEERLNAATPTRTRVHYFLHGVDCAHFEQARHAVPATHVARLSGPRIGYFGLIYEKIDFELLTAVAKQWSTGSLVMIGPVDSCPDEFRRLPNVHLMGAQPYEDLPAWLAGLDVLLLPYVRDEMIRQSSPLKLRECLATGKPTVSVDIAEVRRFEPHVRVASNCDEFVAAVRQSLEPQSASAARERQLAVAGDDWNCRAVELRQLIESLPAREVY
ncbi:MAG: glycosyltransferase [Pirellulales bacterium]|nr:glycosyltransferase [Pirellulales bacterium]